MGPRLRCESGESVPSQHVAYPHSDLTHAVIGAYYRVYNALGSGFREIVYERAMALELADTGLQAERQVPITVWYRKRQVGTFRADLVVERTVLLELKALPRLESSHVAQTLNALKATQLPVALLLNFGPKPSIKRLVATDRAERS